MQCDGNDQDEDEDSEDDHLEGDISCARGHAQVPMLYLGGRERKVLLEKHRMSCACSQPASYAVYSVTGQAYYQCPTCFAYVEVQQSVGRSFPEVITSGCESCELTPDLLLHINARYKKRVVRTKMKQVYAVPNDLEV